MQRLHAKLRDDALRIWKAGVDAVDSARLVAAAMQVDRNQLVVAGHEMDLDHVRKVAVVGAGKAGAGMAWGLLESLGPQVIAQKQVTGWINVPADCVRPLEAIHLHPARPAGRNEPTQDGVAGSEAILRIAGSLGPDDLCLCLISGGASALLPAPVEGISLEDKLAVTKHLSAAGANIAELNTVRKQLSRIKGGGLARACSAGRLMTLLISDVTGDPLDVIGSGPTVEDSSTPEQALEVLERFHARHAGISPAVFEVLKRKRAGQHGTGRPGDESDRPPCQVINEIIGNNALAVEAAGREAERLGYTHAMVVARQLEGTAEEVGRHLAQTALHMRSTRGPDCLISGGEPVVELVDEAHRGLGGRNQQLALAALERLAGDGCQRIALVSGGTDGEDGPTDAAGALLDREIVADARRQKLDPIDFLARNDAYHFFERTGGLIKTGPTHTNVGDIRVVVVSQSQDA